MIKSKRLFGEIITSLLILSGFIAPASGASYKGEDTPHDTQPSRTFEVKVGVADDVYQVGDTAKFRVRVDRVVHGNYVGPAAGVFVTVQVSVDEVSLAGGGTTDARGRVLIEIAIKSHVPAGVADVTVFASKQAVDVPRHSEFEYEFGDAEAPNLFRITR